MVAVPLKQRKEGMLAALTIVNHDRTAANNPIAADRFRGNITAHTRPQLKGSMVFTLREVD